MKAENRKGCLQRDSVEREGYAGVRSIGGREEAERGGAGGLLEGILDRDNLNRAYKRVRSNKGAPGIDQMTVEDALPWLQEHGQELTEKVRTGKYKPNPVRRKEIPKPDGGARRLGIPTVVDRVIQQAIAQRLQAIVEPRFCEGSYGYRPGRNGQQAIKRVERYAREGYTHVVQLDLSKYFDTLNHERLMSLLRERIKDGRVTELVKKYLKSGAMENGVIQRTEAGSPQGGPLSPLLANIYLNEFDWEMKRRGVRFVRYADDIVLFAKSHRAARRMLESSQRLLEGKLRLQVNRDKSRVTSVYSKKFKFLGMTLGKNGKGIFIRVHPQALRKCKQKLKALTRRNRGRNVRQVMGEVKTYLQGWLGYFYIADMKRKLFEWTKWLRRRFRAYIWKQWKKPKARIIALKKLGISHEQAYQWGNSRLGCWRVAGSQILKCSITDEKLIQAGYFDFPAQYERLRKLHLCG